VRGPGASRAQRPTAPAFAALVKIFALRQGGAAAAQLWEVAEAAVAFALLCAGAAALRNFLARRLIWPQGNDARR
jgi:hypothetical protein